MVKKYFEIQVREKFDLTTEKIESALNQTFGLHDFKVKEIKSTANMSPLNIHVSHGKTVIADGNSGMARGV